MKTYSYFFFMICLLNAACENELTERRLHAKLSLRNNCNHPFSFNPDSMDVVMRLFDDQSKPIIDADVLKRVGPNDSLFKLDLRLKPNDKWSITEIRTKYGNPYCTGCTLIDTMLICKPDSGITGLGMVHPLTDTIQIKLSCSCRRLYE